MYDYVVVLDERLRCPHDHQLDGFQTKSFDNPSMATYLLSGPHVHLVARARLDDEGGSVAGRWQLDGADAVYCRRHGLAELDPEVWRKSRALFRVGEPPFQIDILLQISGIGYQVASADAVMGAYGDVPVRFLGRAALIANKKASGRPKDLADVDLLTSNDPERTS